MRKLFLLLMLIILFQTSFSQVKYEKESRIKRNKVPANALSFIDSCFVSKNVYWIYETNLNNKHSIEAKTKHLGEKFSIEFDTLGNIQDVELNIEFVQIPEKTRNEISKNIEKEFLKFKFKEIQIQWLGNHKAQFELIKTRKTNENYTQNYEIVIVGNKNNKQAYFELLFNSEGTVLKEVEIIENNNDNLEFQK
jgi:hypothetical protein